MGLNYFIIAGEASGDMHASHLMHEMKKINSNITFEGIGGPLMTKQGFDSLVDLNKMAVMGFWEVLKNFTFLKQVENKVLEALEHSNVDALILIDYPGFNLRIAKKIKKIKPSIPIFYYISPQIWAWKENRINNIKKYIDKMIVIFDFEYEWYRKRGVDVKFVGHPFIDIYQNFDRNKALSDLGLEKNKKYLTLFPGSRNQEISNHLPHMLQAVQNDFFNDFEILLGQSTSLKENLENKYDLGRVRVIKNQPEKALAIADFGWVGSGTSTLESVILNTPIVLVYKTSAFSWYLMKRVIKVKYAGMPNIILDDMLIPELLQYDLNSKRLIAETKRFFSDTNYKQKILTGYQKIKNKLGQPGASKRAADYIIKAT